MNLSSDQNRVAESGLGDKIFLSGPAGTGKTTAALHRLTYLAERKVPGHEILLFFPQRNLSGPYIDLIDSPSFPSTSKPVAATLGGIARRIINHFWPVIKNRELRFSGNSAPVFLTLESSLYFMSKVVEPLILENGYFSSVTIQRNRLYSQILDNLNKSAIHEFPHTEIGSRLLSAWIGDSSQGMIYQQAQEAASLFREYCYQNNLLDYSLQVELFLSSFKEIDLIKDFVQGQYSHLIYDNSEEDVPAAHGLINDLLDKLDSALILFDTDAGYRSFLGASPASALELADTCSEKVNFVENFVAPVHLEAFSRGLTSTLYKRPPDLSEAASIDETISITYRVNLPELSSWLSAEIDDLLSSGAVPRDIVIIAPYLSDSTRFLLTDELTRKSIPYISHRPSRALREEPSVQCLLTLAVLAHPDWDINPSINELATAFFQAISGIDLPRAYLLARHTLTRQSGRPELADFEQFPSELKERVTFYFGSRYQVLIDWLNNYKSAPPLPLDHFIVLLFGDILSQPGFGFHDDFTQSRIVDQIRSSIQFFRLAAGKVYAFGNNALGAEYLKMVKTGILANQHLPSWRTSDENAVYIAPAYTYLLSNNPVDYQFWLDTGSRGWYERIYQPLTNPFVLSRDWISGNQWRDLEEQEHNLLTLNRISTGLIRRCRKKIYFCLTETDDLGYEQKGILLQALNSLQKSFSTSDKRGGDD